MRQSPAALVAAVLVVLAATGAVVPLVAGAPASGPPGDAPPEDPPADALGWEDGYWYNESIPVTAADGFNDTERDAVVSRSMARVERIRRLEFERRVPVEVVTRQQLRDRLATLAGPVSRADRLHQNVKYEALYMVGESTDALAVQRANRGATIGGYYDPRSGRIVLVSENATAPRIDEITLAQELFHALQDQRFDVDWQRGSTREAHNALDGIVEGDGNYVDYLYERRCEAEWNCLADSTAPPAAGDTAVANFGMYLLAFQPYSDGPPFVKAIHESGGWAAVNAVYENPPASTEQTIHPEKYGVDAPTNVTVADRSDDRWRPLDLEGSVDHAAFGEAGIFSMLWYPSYEASQRSGTVTNVVIPYAKPFNLGNDSRLDRLDPINYSHPASAGWDGDRLLPYVTDESRETNETGYVWKTAWDTERDAREFAAAYRKLLEYHDAERVGNATYRLPEDGGSGDAVHLVVRNKTVTIVNAPTVDDLSGVRTSVTVEPIEAGGGAGAGDGAENRTTNGTENRSNATDGGSGASGPGFGPPAALVALALVLVALLARARS
ncbi:Hvo_1808 family surface protein [Halomarina pelagica]|uniref:Hvo_1808 family surface protein n=1 Tax=Halomarina pelagica TaxID=2961599 RepID=UPI0020C447DC|nr:Hvo_1808 family surface protein [Halomarina sp. BND7]